MSCKCLEKTILETSISSPFQIVISTLLVLFAVRIGLLYLISGFGGSLLSALFIQSSISVGASGALFGLLGGMLSELLTNWTIYANKVNQFVLNSIFFPDK